VVIAGGGLAGLALSIQLARKSYSVILLEKEQYPFHRVCGEYVSMESWEFLHSLGLDLKALNVSSISRLQVSGVNGKLLEQKLPLGGFGISRYRLDHCLAKLARQAGVVILENTKVKDIFYHDERFSVETVDQTYQARVACGTYGKRSNLDIKWKRPFTLASKNALNNYIGVKYHVRINYPIDTIALHNFKDGYCGIVKIEDDKYNLCYLTTAFNLQSSGNIRQLEEKILCKNSHLKKIWQEADLPGNEPVTISQISFDKKSQVENHVLMIGDAAGMITPLCGNGMSMALHGSKLAAEEILRFLRGECNRAGLEEEYTLKWRKNFSKRLRMGRMIQRLLGSNRLTNALITAARIFPGLTRFLIRQTHGQSF
jgi:flavin-dependent dehydrogenase